MVTCCAHAHLAMVDVFHSCISNEDFRRDVSKRRRPALLKGFCLGPASSLWTPSYLKEMGGKKDVRIHVSPTPRMDFISKNFAYK